MFKIAHIFQLEMWITPKSLLFSGWILFGLYLSIYRLIINKFFFVHILDPLQDFLLLKFLVSVSHYTDTPIYIFTLDPVLSDIIQQKISDPLIVDVLWPCIWICPHVSTPRSCRVSPHLWWFLCFHTSTRSWCHVYRDKVQGYWVPVTVRFEHAVHMCVCFGTRCV
jgi:hypothetical protein